MIHAAEHELSFLCPSSSGINVSFQLMVSLQIEILAQIPEMMLDLDQEIRFILAMEEKGI
jgi:hypothetical protein